MTFGILKKITNQFEIYAKSVSKWIIHPTWEQMMMMVMIMLIIIIIIIIAAITKQLLYTKHYIKLFIFIFLI